MDKLHQKEFWVETESNTETVIYNNMMFEEVCNVEKRVFTLKDFFDNIREIVIEARDWWGRECSCAENERLLKKYNIVSYNLTDEKIVNMYLNETVKDEEIIDDYTIGFSGGL